MESATSKKLKNPIADLRLLHILNDGFLASFPLLLPFIQKDLGIGFGAIGFLSGVLGSAAVIMALPSSFIADRFGGMRTLAVAVVLYSNAFIITGFASGIVSLALAFAVASLAFGVFHPISFALVAHGSEANNVGNRMGTFTAVGDIGKIGISAAATFLAAALTWRTTAFIYGLVPLSLMVFSLVFCRPPETHDTKTEKKAAASSRALRRNKKFIYALMACGIDSFASSSLFIFLPFLLTYRNIPGAFLGSLSGAFFIGNMLGKVLFGKIADKFDGFHVFIASEILMTILLYFLSGEDSAWMIAALSILLGAVTKGTVPVINTIIADAVADRNLYEKAFALVFFIGGIAGVLAPLVFGLAAENFGILSVFHLSACFALLAIVPGILNFFTKPVPDA